MDLNRIMDLLREFRDDRDWARFHSVRNLSIALSVETSELLQLIQWVEDNQVESWLAQENHHGAVTDEIADIFIYLLYLVDRLGMDLERSVLSKIERNESRFPEQPWATGHDEPEVTG